MNLARGFYGVTEDISKKRRSVPNRETDVNSRQIALEIGINPNPNLLSRWCRAAGEGTDKGFGIPKEEEVAHLSG